MHSLDNFNDNNKFWRYCTADTYYQQKVKSKSRLRELFIAQVSPKFHTTHVTHNDSYLES